jgi:hypothetical protein
VDNVVEEEEEEEEANPVQFPVPLHSASLGAEVCKRLFAREDE